MNLIELQHALRQLRLGGTAAVLETRLRQAQAEAMAPIDLISCLVSDELARRSDRLLDRRRKQAAFRDPQKTLDNFDFTFNPKMNRSLVFDLATCAFIGKREDALLLGPGGTGKSHLAQAIGQAAIQQNYRVMYRETHVLLEDLAEAVVDGTRKQFMESVATVPLLIIDDFGMRKLPLTAAEDLLEIIMRRYERAGTLLTSNRPVEDWGKPAQRAPRRCGCRRRHARPHSASRARAQVWPTELADENGDRCGRPSMKMHSTDSPGAKPKRNAGQNRPGDHSRLMAQGLRSSETPPKKVRFEHPKTKPSVSDCAAKSEGLFADAFFGASPVVASALGIRLGATPRGRINSNMHPLPVRPNGGASYDRPSNEKKAGRRALRLILRGRAMTPEKPLA
jgi:DNA replication protein DnaC